MTPEQREIQSKEETISQLQKKLADIDAEYADLCVEVQKFQTRYMDELGTLYQQLDRWNLRIASTEMLINRLRDVRDGLLTAPADPFVWSFQCMQQAQQEWTEQQHAKRLQEQEAEEPIPLSSENQQKIKAMYRNLARRFHPDLVQNEEARQARTSLMSQINEAYQKGDIEKLHQFLDHHDIMEPNEEKVGDVLVRLIRRIDQLQHLISQAQQRLQKELQTDLVQLYQQCRKVEAQRGDAFDLLRKAVLEQIQKAKMEWMCQRARESKLWTEVE